MLFINVLKSCTIFKPMVLVWKSESETGIHVNLVKQCVNYCHEAHTFLFCLQMTDRGKLVVGSWKRYCRTTLKSTGQCSVTKSHLQPQALSDAYQLMSDLEQAMEPTALECPLPWATQCTRPLSGSILHNRMLLSYSVTETSCFITWMKLCI